jgi:hypothetical protein
MKKRTIERKSKDGFLNSMAKNLGLKAKEEPKAETREFDDLIETLRTGEIVVFVVYLLLWVMWSEVKFSNSLVRFNNVEVAS